MIGINDKMTLYNSDTKTNNILYIEKSKKVNLKIYNLFVLLKKHLQQLLTNNLLFANDKNGMIDNAIPVFGIVGCILVYIEGFYRILLLLASKYSVLLDVFKSYLSL